MSRSPKHIYAAAVCFTAVVCMAVATGVALYSLVRTIVPSITSSSYQSQLQIPPVSYGGTRMAYPAAVLNGVGPPAQIMPPALTPEQIKEMQDRGLAQALAYERTAGIRGFVLWGIVLLVSGALWLLHWRALRSESSNAV